MTEVEYKDEKAAARRMLRSYNSKCAAIANIPGQIRLLELKATSIRSATSDAAPARGGGNNREEALNANIDRRERLKSQLEAAELSVEIVDRAMASLTPTQQHILQLMHINRHRGNVERLRRELGFEDKRSVYKQEDLCIEAFLVALNNSERPRTNVKVRKAPM